MPKQSCIIDQSNCTTSLVKTRSKKKLKLFFCKNCDFEFFLHNPKKNLAKNKLDISRLKKAGLNIPNLREDFQNGLNQSKTYIEKYIRAGDRGKNILEVGSSWGYFLYLLKKKGCIPFGLEINKIRSSYIRSKFKIRCDNSLQKIENEGVKFKKIFLFYVLEYIPYPKTYVTRLIKLLDKRGSIIIYTPNKNDVLKDLLKSRDYLNFFYDENSINYFSQKSLINLMKMINIKKYKLSSHQGYSIANFFNWHLNKSPHQTGMVGGDYFIDKLVEFLISLNKSKKERFKEGRKKIINFLLKINSEYKKILEKQNIGNQIILEIKK